MILWFSAHDYTHGLEPNLVAEFAGLLVSLAVTYLIVDRVVRDRLRANQMPLRGRFKDGVHGAASLLHFSWSVVLGVVSADELRSGSYDSLESRVEGEISDASPESLVQRIRAQDRDGVLLLGKYTVANVKKISDLADRFAGLVGQDVKLHGLIADVEDSAREVALAMEGRSASADPGFIDLVDAGIVGLSRATWQRARALTRYASEALQ